MRLRTGLVLETGAAWLLALLWLLPLAYAFWAAFHPPEMATHFDLFAPLTLSNFAKPGATRRSRGTSSIPSCW